MRPADNIKRMIKNLNDQTSAEMDKRVLGDVMQALDDSVKTATPSRRFIMKSPVIKFAAAAAIIIAVLIGIGHFGRNGSSIALADITEQFESVPFFNLTIYLSYDTSAEAKKVEIFQTIKSSRSVQEIRK